MNQILAVERLNVAYRGNQAVQVETLSLAAGGLAGVVGANGAGKSTLVNAIAGWSRGDPRVTGRVLLDGQDISHLPAHQRVQHGLMLVPEGNGVFHRMSTEENLRAMVPQGDAARRRAFSMAQIYDLFPRLQERRTNVAGSLSGGERQMLAVGRALRMGPRVLLLDEPSIGLAPRLVLSLLLSIRKLVDEGLSVLLVEQNVRAALEVVDQVFLLERGRVIATGSAAEMREDTRIVDAYLGTARA